MRIRNPFMYLPLLLALFCIPLLVSAQEKVEGEKVAGHILLRIDSLAYRSDSLRGVDTALAYGLYSEAIDQISAALSDWKLSENRLRETRKQLVSRKASLLLRRAQFETDFHRYSSAIADLNLALSLFSSIVEEEGIARCNIAKADAYLGLDELKKAEDHLRKAATYLEENQDATPAIQGKYLLCLSKSRWSNGKEEEAYANLLTALPFLSMDHQLFALFEAEKLRAWFLRQADMEKLAEEAELIAGSYLRNLGFSKDLYEEIISEQLKGAELDIRTFEDKLQTAQAIYKAGSKYYAQEQVKLENSRDQMKVELKQKSREFRQMKSGFVVIGFAVLALLGFLIWRLLRIQHNLHKTQSLLDASQEDMTDLETLKEKALEEKDRQAYRIETITRILPDIVAVIDIEGIFTEAAIPSKISFAYAEEELVGKAYYQVFSRKASRDFEKALKKVQEGSEMEVLQIEMVVARQKKVYDLHLTRAWSTEYVLVIRDVSERMEYENMLRESKEKAEESDRLKSAFLSNISHEIRTPMNAIVGFSHLLDDEEISGEERKSYLGLITQNTSQLITIISDIMELSKMESGVLQIQETEVNVNLKLHHMEEWMRREKLIGSKSDISVRVRKTLPESKSVILTDPERLEQVFRYLIDNAVKFTEEGTIEMGYEVLNDNYLEFYIKDTGIGIPKDKQMTIFDRFKQIDDSHTREYGGTGLGLALASKIVNILGGEIYVKSEPGKGSVFYFTHPYIGVTKAKPERFSGKEENTDYKEQVDQLREDATPCWDSRQILVVDDDSSSIDYFRNLLARTACHVFTAMDGITALEYLSNENIDLILMDIRMPDMDGITLFKHIRKMDESVPVIAHTAYADEYPEEKLKEIGFTDSLSKPFRSDILLEKIAKQLDRNESLMI